MKEFEGYEDCEEDNFEKVKTIVENEAELNESLCKACESGNFASVKFLIENKACIGWKDESPLYFTAKSGNLDIMNFLIENKADVKYSEDLCIQVASTAGHSHIVKALLENKADISQNYQAVCRAIKSNHFDILKILIENKAPVEHKNNRSAPLEIAVEENLTDIAKFLVENKADITACDNYAFRTTVFNRNLELTKFLIENKAEISCRENESFFLVVSRGDLNFVKLLLENKPELIFEEAAIIHASMHNKFQVVKYLASKGMNTRCIKKCHLELLISSKFFRRWRISLFKRKLRNAILYLYYSPKFQGGSKDKKQLEKFISNLNQKNNS